VQQVVGEGLDLVLVPKVLDHRVEVRAHESPEPRRAVAPDVPVPALRVDDLPVELPGDVRRNREHSASFELLELPDSTKRGAAQALLAMDGFHAMM
jgi:hypothetical protein